MPTREQTVDDAIRVFRTGSYPDGLSLGSAWLGIYQTLLWYEPVNWLGFGSLPHIIDADKLRPGSNKNKQGWRLPNAWQQRAQAVGKSLAGQLGCSIAELPEITDRLMRHPDYEGMQRQNSLGIAFVGLIGHVLKEYGSSSVAYRMECEASRVFPGISVPGRSGTPRIDLLADRDGVPCAVISAKWSVRHDRLSDIANECPVYKAAYERIHRQTRRSRLLYYVVTNEYDPSRLNKMLDDSCVDGVVHVHKSAVVDVCALDGRLTRLIDLADFVESTTAW